MNNDKRSIVLIIIAGFFLVICLVYYILIAPLQHELKDTRAAAARLVAENNVLEQVITAKGVKQEQFGEEEVQAQLPLWDNAEQLVYTLDDIGNKTLVSYSIHTFTYSDTNTLGATLNVEQALFPNVGEVTITSEIKGSYSQIRSWLEQIQNQDRVVIVRSLDYSLSSLTEYSAVVQIQAFFDPTYAPLLEQPIWP